jgi:hypothetical protein
MRAASLAVNEGIWYCPGGGATVPTRQRLEIFRALAEVDKTTSIKRSRCNSSTMNQQEAQINNNTSEEVMEAQDQTNELKTKKQKLDAESSNKFDEQNANDDHQTVIFPSDLDFDWMNGCDDWGITNEEWAQIEQRLGIIDDSSHHQR